MCVCAHMCQEAGKGFRKKFLYKHLKYLIFHIFEANTISYKVLVSSWWNMSLHIHGVCISNSTVQAVYKILCNVTDI